MILENNCGRVELHKAAATERGRYATESIHSTKLENGKLRCAATNGRILARVDLAAAAEDVEGWIPTEAWQAGLKAASKDAAPSLSANGTIAVRNKANTATTHFDRPEGGEFPRYEELIPEGYRDAACKRFVRFALNPAYLLEVAQAIGQSEGAPGVTLHLQVEEYHDLEPVVGPDNEPMFEQVPVCYPGTDKQAIDLEGNPKFQNGKPLMREAGEVRWRAKRGAPMVVTNTDPDAVGVIMPIVID